MISGVPIHRFKKKTPGLLSCTDPQHEHVSWEDQDLRIWLDLDMARSLSVKRIVAREEPDSLLASAIKVCSKLILHVLVNGPVMHWCLAGAIRT